MLVNVLLFDGVVPFFVSCIFICCAFSNSSVICSFVLHTPLNLLPPGLGTKRWRSNAKSGNRPTKTRNRFVFVLRFPILLFLVFSFDMHPSIFFPLGLGPGVGVLVQNQKLSQLRNVFLVFGSLKFASYWLFS